MAGDLSEAERMLAADLIRPLLVPNSSFSEEATETERDVQAAAVEPVIVRIAQNQVIARSGEPLDAADIETIEALGLGDDSGRRRQLRGLVPAVGPAGRDAPGLAVALPTGPLAPRQRAAAHRPAARRRDARAQGHRGSLDPAVLPADGGHRDAPRDPARRLGRGHRHRRSSPSSAAAVERRRRSEFATYIFLGGLAGIVGVRKGDRLQVFVQAAHRRVRRQRDGRVGLLVARHARHAWRAGAVVRLRRRRPPGRPSRRSGRSPCSARCSGS